MTSEAKAASTSSSPLNEQDVQFLSDGYDDLVKSGKGVSGELKKKLERRLNAFEFCVSNIAKAIDNIFVYSYQYNIKITSDRETSEETANFCLMMFAGIGVDISISDINIAHRVQTRKLGFSVILQLWAMFVYGCACLSNWSQIVSGSDQFMLEGCCLFLHLALLSQLLYLNWIMLALCALLLNPGWRWLPLMAQAIYRRN